MQNAQLIHGENGALEHTAESVGDGRVALFFALVRGIEDGRLAELMQGCIGDQTNGDLPAIVADLFVLAMQTRDCRGGKGERVLCYKMLLQLYKTYPNTVLKLLTLLGEYGYYKDFFQLYEITGEEEQFQILRNKITDIVANQLIQDEASLTNSAGGKVSMCAKYCPREGKHFDTGKASAFSGLVNKLYPAVGAHKVNKKQYRQLIAKLTKALDVPEVKMCGKRFSELDFAKVPSVCAKKFCKAFLNEKLKSMPAPAEEETGNRYPADEDRILCRQNLVQAALDQKVKGKQLFPHEIVQTLYDGHGRVSSMEQVVFNAQWKDIRAHLMEQLTAASAPSTENGTSTPAPAINLGKLVPLSDVSGSMDGTPMIVSIALGILVSEVNHPAFRDRVLTFETHPQWVNLSELSTIAQKVEKLRHAPWGGSTDVDLAFQRIRDVVRENRLPVEEVPDLIIFSDMQFDEAVGAQQQTTQLERVRQMFAEVGVEICGYPYPAPKIIFWNLRSGTQGFPAQAEDENVQMLSGFSPSLLKFVLEGAPMEGEEEVVTETGEVVKVAKAKPTPYETLRRVLDDERYFAVRQLLSESSEGHLVQYHFEAPLPAVAPAQGGVQPPAPPVL